MGISISKLACHEIPGLAGETGGRGEQVSALKSAHNVDGVHSRNARTLTITGYLAPPSLL